MTFQDFRKTTLGEVPAAFIGVPLLKKSNVAMDRAQERRARGLRHYSLLAGPHRSCHERALRHGRHGQTFAVAPDNTILTNLPLAKSPTAGQPASTLDIDVAKAKEAGGPQQRYAHACSRNIDFMGSPWTVVAEFENEEALRDAVALKQTMSFAGLIILAGQLLVGFFIARGIVRPINTLTNALKVMAGGKLSTEVAGKNRKDELVTSPVQSKAFATPSRPKPPVELQLRKKHAAPRKRNAAA